MHASLKWAGPKSSKLQTVYPMVNVDLDLSDHRTFVDETRKRRPTISSPLRPMTTGVASSKKPP